MHIINAMFAKSLGGIEQCAVDYAEALVSQGHQVTCLVRKKAAIISELKKLSNVKIVETTHLSQWNPFSKQKLKKQLSLLNPDIVIAHGNRALSLLAVSKVPVIGVTHNYSLDHMKKADAVIALTDDLATHAIKAGVKATNIIRLPNMIRLSATLPKPKTSMQQPPHIAAMGRFVPKKGFDIFLHALADLKKRNVPFKATLAGDGDEAAKLKQLAHDLGLNKEHIEFAGWIKEKEELFEKSDIFCIPSHHEPFGIIVLEALAHALPTVSTASEGPSEILNDEETALLTPLGDAKKLADALERLISDRQLAMRLAKNGQALVTSHYEMSVVAKQLSEALKKFASPTI